MHNKLWFESGCLSVCRDIDGSVKNPTASFARLSHRQRAQNQCTQCIYAVWFICRNEAHDRREHNIGRDGSGFMAFRVLGFNLTLNT